LELLQVGPGQRALDIGCGDGAIAARLAARGVRVVAVDLAMAMAARAQRRGAVAVVADMCALPFRSRFEGVACVGSSEFVASLETLTSELAGSMQPGGELVLLFPRRNWLGWLLWLFHRRHGVRVHLRSRRAVVGALSAAGFEPPVLWRRRAAAWVCRTQLGPRAGGGAS
jgi:SAM-dependent methyltransferase